MEQCIWVNSMFQVLTMQKYNNNFKDLKQNKTLFVECFGENSLIFVIYRPYSVFVLAIATSELLTIFYPISYP